MQLTAVVALDYVRRPHRLADLGDIELGLKYLFVHEDDGILPDIAIFPTVLVPTGSHKMDGGHAALSVPLWLQKDWGRWSWFGGGGYTLRAGRDHKNGWLYGTAFSRELSERLRAGAEIFHETRSERGEAETTGVNVGVNYDLGEYAATASIGPAWSGRARGLNIYIAIVFQE